VKIFTMAIMSKIASAIHTATLAAQYGMDARSIISTGGHVKIGSLKITDWN
jgi:hypothetical protein